MWILKIIAGNLAIVFIIELSLGIGFGAKTVRKIVTMALINVVTNPFVVLSRMCMTLFFEKWEHLGILVLELFAYFVEGVTYSKFKTFEQKNPYLISLVLNLTSFTIGEIINIFI